MSTEWMGEAACNGLTFKEADRIYFPTDGDYTLGKELCSHCEVRGECLAAVRLHKATDGLYAGLTPEEREELGISTKGTPRARSQGRVHGTRSMWCVGCRCIECVEANRAYSRKAKQRRKQGIPAPPIVQLPTYNKEAS